MSGYARIWLMIGLLVTMALGIIVISNLLLYDAHFQQQSKRLFVLAKNEANLIDKMSNNPDDRFQSKEEIVRITIKKIRQEFMKYAGFDPLGEIVIAHRAGDKIEFLYSRVHGQQVNKNGVRNELVTSSSVPYQSKLAEPMRRALAGEAGTIIAADYSGKLVLAAHVPLKLSGFGVVAKIDMSKLREPFIRAGSVSGFALVFIIIVGSLFIKRIGTGLVDEARTTAERLVGVQRAAKVGSWEWDIRRNHLIWSDEIHNILGFSPGEVSPSFEAYVARIHPDDKKAVSKALQAMPIDFHSDHRIVLPDGSERYVHEDAEISQDQHGNATHVTGLLRDDTQLTMYTRALANNEERIRAIVENVLDAIITIDSDGKIETLNPAVENIFGYTAIELVGENISVLMGDSLKSYLETTESQTIKVGREVQGVRKDGRIVELELAISELWLGEQKHYLGVLHDISEMKEYERHLENHSVFLGQQVSERTKKLEAEVHGHRRTENALRESQERLTAITESLITGVLVLGSSGDISFANKSAQAMLGVNSGTPLEGHDIDDIFHILLDGQKLSFADGPLVSVCETGESELFDDITLVKDSGEIKDFSMGCSPLLQHGRQTGIIISFRDITDFKIVQNEALQASRLASVGQLAAGIAHEINTPIQYIGDNLRFLSEAHTDYTKVFSAYEGLLQSARNIDQMADEVTKVEAVTGDADIEYLREEIPIAIRQSIDGVERVSGIVMAMKEFSHPGSKRKELANLSHIIETTATVCANEWKHHADMTLNLDPTLKMVPCYAGELNQVILNLIVNAAHAISEKNGPEKGQITISTGTDGGWAEIRVADTGAGMPEEIRDRIFDPFFTTKDVGKGTGQGLSISRDVIVKKHAGKIEVTSREGEGTEFIIRLPLESET